MRFVLRHIAFTQKTSLLFKRVTVASADVVFPSRSPDVAHQLRFQDKVIFLVLQLVDMLSEERSLCKTASTIYFQSMHIYWHASLDLRQKRHVHATNLAVLRKNLNDYIVQDCTCLSNHPCACFFCSRLGRYIIWNFLISTSHNRSTLFLELSLEFANYFSLRQPVLDSEEINILKRG